MPELPEVETIRRELEPLIRGRTILRARLGREDIIGFPGAAEFLTRIAGWRIDSLGRRGKYLLLLLSRSRRGLNSSRGRGDPKRPAAKTAETAGGTTRALLVIHLRLSGHLEVRPSRDRPLRFERIRLLLSGGRSLCFIEPRVLGRVYLVPVTLPSGRSEPAGGQQSGRLPTRGSADLPAVLGGLRTMGLEPIEPGFCTGYLRERIRGRKTTIKGLLLDQSIAAGVGNIYSDEALFRAGVRPTRRACRVTGPETARLVRALRTVLNEGIRNMGTTMSDARYQRPNRLPGGFQGLLRVFDREGEPCRVCGAEIRACRIGNRTSRYCPRCQR